MTPFSILVASALLAPGSAANDAGRLAKRAQAVIVQRDEWGIAHVRAKTDADAIFGMAYVQAEDDFNRVEANYLTNLGRLSEAEGEQAVWSDLRQKLWVDEDDLKRRFVAAPAWLRSLAEGWADGLNFYLATHPQVRPRALHRFEPWMVLSFSEGSIGGDIEYVKLDALKALYGGGKLTSAEPRREEPQGSNGIAIGSSRSADGRALLLINPHTSFFFRDVVQVTSDEGLDVFGAVTWGQPFVYQGFNRHAGWMHTSSGLDNRDEFAETLAAGSGLSYKFGGSNFPVGRRNVTVRVRQPDGSISPRAFTTYFTRHGPIVRAENGKWIAYSIMYDPVNALAQSFLRTKARNLKEFVSVSARRANSSNNTIFADSSGTIAYLHPQFVPVRDPRFDYRGVIDGSDPRTEWRGLHSLDSLPQVVNPPSGFVFNVNDAPWPAAGPDTLKPSAFPAYMDQWGWNARTDHALALLGRGDKLTPAGLQALAFDRALPGFERILPALLADYDALPAADPRRTQLAGPIALLRAWDRRWSEASQALTLAVHWGEAFTADVMTGTDVANYDEVAFARMAKAGSAQRLGALQSAIGKLEKLYGDWRVAWGTINRLQRNDGAIRQTFDDAKPSLAVGFPSADWGTLASFGARTYPGTVKRYGTSGNSFIAVVAFGRDGPEARVVTVGGVSGDPTSPHFADQSRAYVAGDLKPMHFNPADVAAHAVETYHPGGARRVR